MEPSTKGNKKTFAMSVLDNLVLTGGTKLFKNALFVRTGPNDQILRALERQYYKLAADAGSPALSLLIIEHLAPLYGEDPGDWSRRFEELFTRKEAVLREVFQAQAQRPHERSVFFFQPELLMVYDRLLQDQYRLRETWNHALPEAELDRSANVFGFSFD